MVSSGISSRGPEWEDKAGSSNSRAKCQMGALEAHAHHLKAQGRKVSRDATFAVNWTTLRASAHQSK
jgi:hypothetical protein